MTRNNDTTIGFQSARNKLISAAMQRYSREDLAQALMDAGVEIDDQASHRSLAHRYAYYLLPPVRREVKR